MSLHSEMCYSSQQKQQRHILTPRPGIVSSAGTLREMVLHLEKKKILKKKHLHAMLLNASRFLDHSNSFFLLWNCEMVKPSSPLNFVILLTICKFLVLSVTKVLKEPP